MHRSRKELIRRRPCPVFKSTLRVPPHCKWHKGIAFGACFKLGAERSSAIPKALFNLLQRESFRIPPHAMCCCSSACTATNPTASCHCADGRGPITQIDQLSRAFPRTCARGGE